MTYSTEAEIRSLVSAFEDGTLPRDCWTHAAHLTVGLWYLTQEATISASCNAGGTAHSVIRQGIQRYNAAHGIESTPTSGYHETITLFWIQMIQNFLASVDRRNSLLKLTNQLLNQYPDPKRLFQYYSRDRLLSSQARLAWIEPDLQSL